MNVGKRRATFVLSLSTSARKKPTDTRDSGNETGCVINEKKHPIVQSGPHKKRVRAVLFERGTKMKWKSGPTSNISDR